MTIPLTSAMPEIVQNPFARRVDGADVCGRCGETMWHSAFCRHAQVSWRMWCQVTNGHAPREKCDCGTCRIVRKENGDVPGRVWEWTAEREAERRADVLRRQPVSMYRKEVRARHIDPVEVETLPSRRWQSQLISTAIGVAMHDWQERKPRRRSGRRAFRRQWAAQSEVRRIMRAS